jgi:hypothetical protein
MYRLNTQRVKGGRSVDVGIKLNLLSSHCKVATDRSGSGAPKTGTLDFMRVLSNDDASRTMCLCGPQIPTTQHLHSDLERAHIGFGEPRKCDQGQWVIRSMSMDIGVRSLEIEAYEVVEEEQVPRRSPGGLIASRALPDMRGVAWLEAEHPLCRNHVVITRNAEAN